MSEGTRQFCNYHCIRATTVQQGWWQANICRRKQELSNFIWERADPPDSSVAVFYFTFPQFSCNLTSSFVSTDFLHPLRNILPPPLIVIWNILPLISSLFFSAVWLLLPCFALGCGEGEGRQMQAFLPRVMRHSRVFFAKEEVDLTCLQIVLTVEYSADEPTSCTVLCKSISSQSIRICLMFTISYIGFGPIWNEIPRSDGVKWAIKECKIR